MGMQANVEQRVGISEYAYQLLARFAQYKNDGVKYKVYLRLSLVSYAGGFGYRIVTPGSFGRSGVARWIYFFIGRGRMFFFSPNSLCSSFFSCPDCYQCYGSLLLYFR